MSQDDATGCSTVCSLAATISRTVGDEDVRNPPPYSKHSKEVKSALHVRSVRAFLCNLVRTGSGWTVSQCRRHLHETPGEFRFPLKTLRSHHRGQRCQISRVYSVSFCTTVYCFLWSFSEAEVGDYETGEQAFAAAEDNMQYCPIDLPR